MVVGENVSCVTFWDADWKEFFLVHKELYTSYFPYGREKTFEIH